MRDVAELFDRIAPIIPVRDLDAALDRYRRLGFAVRSYEGGERYGFVDRDRVSLHVTESAGHDPATTASMVYLYVSDVDAVHAEWARAGVEGRLSAPRDTPWGLREFAYVDPDGTLHRVGTLPPAA
jgi:catechol 2,3-dioxygenase-like lactoylglutathione lyase family enzyme